MSCSWCNEVYADKGSKFTWTSGKVETLKKHETSKTHEKAVEVKRNENIPVEETQAAKIITQLNQATMEKLEKLFRNVHAIALAGRPFTNIIWMAKLDKAKGLDLGNTYVNHKSAKVFTHFIAEVEKNKIAEQLRMAKFVSVLSDGSTDSSVTEKEIIYARTCQSGVVQVPFLNCATVPKGDAQNIVGAIRSSFEKVGLQWNDICTKMVGMGSDGASVMLGRNKGVAALLRTEQPALVAVHCFAHKLELAFKDATRKVPLDNKVSICLLQALYYLYHNSPLNRKKLETSFKTLDMKTLMPTRIGGTRWVAHLLRAVQNFIRSYPAIKQHLEQVVNASEPVTTSTSGKAKGILKLLVCRDAILYAHLLADVLTVLTRLSKLFQETGASAAVVHGSLDQAISQLKRYETKDGPYLTKAKSLLGLSEEWQMPRRRGESFSASRNTLINGLVQSLQGRFEMEDVIEAMKIANFRVWPLPEETQEIEDFGEESLLTIIQHYDQILEDAGVEAAEATLEWSSLKSLLYASRPAEVRALTWEKVNRLYEDTHKNILLIIDLILTVPGSSSECERGFRQMKSVKTDTRSCLGEESLADQMTIRLHSPSVEEFDPSPAIHLWNLKETRRPLFADSTARKALRKAREEKVQQMTHECGEDAECLVVPSEFNDDLDYDSDSEDSGFDTDDDDLNEESVIKTMRNEGLL